MVGVEGSKNWSDDGWAAFRNTNGPQFYKIKKAFQKMFKNKGLHIIIKYNMKIVNYVKLKPWILPFSEKA